MISFLSGFLGGKNKPNCGCDSKIGCTCTVFVTHLFMFSRFRAVVSFAMEPSTGTTAILTKLFANHDVQKSYSLFVIQPSMMRQPKINLLFVINHTGENIDFLKTSQCKPLSLRIAPASKNKNSLESVWQKTSLQKFSIDKRAIQ